MRFKKGGEGRDHHPLLVSPPEKRRKSGSAIYRCASIRREEKNRNGARPYPFSTRERELRET